MLYMNILTWNPDKRDEVLKRVQTRGLTHEGIKVISTWADVDGGRAFQLTEVPPNMDPKLRLNANFICNFVRNFYFVISQEIEGERYVITG